MGDTTSQVPANAIATTDTCFIRPHDVSDAAALAAAANHEDISRFMRNKFPYPYTIDDASSFIDFSSKGEPRVNFAICLLDGSYAGGIGLVPGDDTRYRTWEIGYWVGKDHWGKGVATNALKSFSAWAFSAFPEIFRLEAGVYEGNHGSMKVLERAGYTNEGISRKAVFKKGKAMDVHNYSLLRSDVEESK